MRLLALLVALVLAGCSGASSEAPATEGPAAEPPTEPADAAAPPPRACESDADCDAGRRCIDGACKKVIQLEERSLDFEDDAVEGDLVEPDSESVESQKGAVDDM